MKVVLSRKGMDSRAGGIPSPILPDGTLLSLPIPNEKSGVPYGDLVYKGRTYQQIIQQIHPTFDFQKHPFCHLDPDIYGVLKNKHAGWKPAFGQYEIPAKHLDGQGVDVGDVFLFYGMFRKTEALPNGTLHFVKGAPIQHIIYGYMVVSEILKDQDSKYVQAQNEAFSEPEQKLSARREKRREKLISPKRTENWKPTI